MNLFEPFELRSCQLRNRIAMSPMTQRMGTAEGMPLDWHLVHYGSRAMGGCGLILFEDTAVQASGRTSTGALGLYRAEQAKALARIVTFCQQQGAAVGIQLAHAGRKALSDRRGGAQMLAPTSEPFATGWRSPMQADERAIAELLDSFANASRLAARAGFDVVEVHAGHGFLLHQFLSALVNHREDGYGGSILGRARLLIEVVEVVRAAWPADRPLLVRLPAGDGVQSGTTIEEMADVALACVEKGADMIDISGGSPVFKGPQVDAKTMLSFAQAIQARAAGSPTAIAIGGGVESGRSAGHLLRSTGASLVTIGRPLLRNPYWVLAAAEEMRGVEQAGLLGSGR